ncbi:hypothetical protein JET18_01405 [Chryseobacterium sp. L7]|uniref:Uncharacterized protein n=1 Tax=Chryseobacterium endalhagicum TaxID=2797638 RepID=A0ABS1QA34_9FLAO|nr:hypothetical protein [Chryseobacterium endalhagicum]MBL1219472.1 hypothetical protein [Chryseobacterium endalhagicum]
MVDLDYVQKLIEKEIGPDFEVRQYFDTKDMIIFFWKHKTYDTDDERGHLIGCRPVIYDKLKDEYRVMGSAEWFSEEICQLSETDESKESIRDHNYLMSLFDQGEEEKEDIAYTKSLIEKIKTNILRRNYVNTDDVDRLSILTGLRRINNECDLSIKPEWKFEKHIVIVSNNNVAKEKLIGIWKEINFNYKTLNQTELLLFKNNKLITDNTQ